MPSYEQHVEQAAHNKALASDLHQNKKGLFNDWVVTVCFYSTVHMVEAMIHENENLRVPTNSGTRYPESRATVKKTGVRHSYELEQDYDKKGHELRNWIIRDNVWFFKLVGTICNSLRDISQSARYDCQSISTDDAEEVRDQLMLAVSEFNSWAIKKSLPPLK